MAWVIILAAGLFETGFAVALKLSHGMTRLWPTVTFAACALMSFALLTVALRRLEVGAAYAVWTGIGAAGTAIAGMIFLGDAVSTLKLVSIAPGSRRGHRPQPVRRDASVTAWPRALLADLIRRTASISPLMAIADAERQQQPGPGLVLEGLAAQPPDEE